MFIPSYYLLNWCIYFVVVFLIFLCSRTRCAYIHCRMWLNKGTKQISNGSSVCQIKKPVQHSPLLSLTFRKMPGHILVSAEVYIHKKRYFCGTTKRHLPVDRGALFNKIFTKGTKGPVWQGRECNTPSVYQAWGGGKRRKKLAAFHLLSCKKWIVWEPWRCWILFESINSRRFHFLMDLYPLCKG